MPYSVTIQMKAAEQYFPVVLFLCCKMWLTFESDGEIPTKEIYMKQLSLVCNLLQL